MKTRHPLASDNITRYRLTKEALDKALIPGSHRRQALRIIRDRLPLEFTAPMAIDVLGKMRLGTDSSYSFVKFFVLGGQGLPPFFYKVTHEFKTRAEQTS